ncbi:hypothetical protein [Pleionea sediminis]|uniref:hypothetical protein n=1 Tax=Pleionea sediminis TaxID=2569479 RepID=UPI0013DE7728|nr:hypothetical protein [Pleionea sediminis]
MKLSKQLDVYCGEAVHADEAGAESTQGTSSQPDGRQAISNLAETGQMVTGQPSKTQ